MKRMDFGTHLAAKDYIRLDSFEAALKVLKAHEEGATGGKFFLSNGASNKSFAFPLRKGRITPDYLLLHLERGKTPRADIVEEKGFPLEASDDATLHILPGFRATTSPVNERNEREKYLRESHVSAMREFLKQHGIALRRVWLVQAKAKGQGSASYTRRGGTKREVYAWKIIEPVPARKSPQKPRRRESPSGWLQGLRRYRNGR